MNGVALSSDARSHRQRVSAALWLPNGDGGERLRQGRVVLPDLLDEFSCGKRSNRRTAHGRPSGLVVPSGSSSSINDFGSLTKPLADSVVHTGRERIGE